MKKTLLFLSILIFSIALSAQIQVPASKSMVGVWRQTGAMTNTGELVKVKSGNYKVINPDGTSYTIITWGNGSTTIGFYATYKITSDSTCTEHIIKHANPAMDGKDVAIRFRLIDENNMRMDWNLGERWINESWTRLQVGNQNRFFSDNHIE